MEGGRGLRPGLGEPQIGPGGKREVRKDSAGERLERERCWDQKNVGSSEFKREIQGGDEWPLSVSAFRVIAYHATFVLNYYNFVQKRKLNEPHLL